MEQTSIHFNGSDKSPYTINSNMMTQWWVRSWKNESEDWDGVIKKNIKKLKIFKKAINLKKAQNFNKGSKYSLKLKNIFKKY